MKNKKEKGNEQESIEKRRNKILMKGNLAKRDLFPEKIELKDLFIY